MKQKGEEALLEDTAVEVVSFFFFLVNTNCVYFDSVALLLILKKYIAHFETN